MDRCVCVQERVAREPATDCRAFARSAFSICPRHKTLRARCRTVSSSHQQSRTPTLPVRIQHRTCPLFASPNVSQRGRVAAKSSSSRRQRQVKIRKSSCGPSSAVLLAVLAPGVRILGQGKTHHSPQLVVQRNWSRYLPLSAAQNCNLQLPVHLAKYFQIRIACRQRNPDFAYRDANLGPDLEQL